MPFWNTQASWERRALSALGRFLLYHLMCCYNLSEMARDRLLVRILKHYTNLEVCHYFYFEQEQVFAYKCCSFIDDRDTGIWVVPYTERIVRDFAPLFMVVYGEYRF